MQKMTELSKYAEEIMVEILSRLPPKSLMRLKCVRKSWQCLINNSNFQAKHLSVSKHNSITIVFQRLVPEDVHSRKKDLLLMLFDLYHHGLDGDDDDHELHPTFEELYTPFSSDLVDCQLFCIATVTHCDGILCLSDHQSYILFCNPAIKEFKFLHVPSSYSGQCLCGDGFGYDLKSKDYKFVRILDHGQEEYKSGDRMRVVKHPPTAVVYSLLTSSWKEIEADNLITKSTTNVPVSNHCIYLNGILYWLGCEQLREVRKIWSEFEYVSEEDEDDHSGLKKCLISFDIGNEAFHVILLPEAFGDLARCGFGVFKFNEAIACCPGWEIWLMEDLGGGEGSWTKYLTFEPVVDGIIEGLFSYNKQLVVVLRSTKCEIVFQEVCTNQFKLLSMDLRRASPDYSVACTSSIVSINGGTRQLDSHDNART